MSRSDIRAGSAFVELYTKNSRWQRGLSDARKQLREFGDDVKAMGHAMIAASAAMLVPIGLSVKRFADFDDKMREVKAVSQSTGAEFDRLTARAKQLGASTSFTAVQVGALMAELGRAGFAADEIDKMTLAVLDLARGTSTDATLASGIMAASIRQFGLGAADATRVADALTVAANKSFNSVESLGEALSYAGPVAADFGMSIEETLAILGALGNVGIQGSNAGTAVRRLLTITGAEATKLKEIFGVSFLDASQNARPLVDVLEEVNEATKNLGTGERAAKFNEAFGLLGITAASAISKTTVSVRDLLNALNGAEGSARKTAQEMDAGLGGAFRILLSAVEGVAIGIGDALAPEIQKLAEWITSVAGDVLKWIEANKELVSSIAKVAVAIGAAGAALVALGGAAGLAATALGGLAALLSPLGLVAAALVAIGAGYAYLDSLTRSSYTLADAKSKLIAENDRLRASELAQFERLKQLASQQSLTSAELTEAGKIIDGLQGKYGDLGLSIDATTGKIDGLAGAQNRLNEAMSKKALWELEDQLHEAQNNVRKLREEFEKQQGFFRAWWREMGGASGTSWFQGGRDGLEGLMEDMTRAELAAARIKKRFEELKATIGKDGSTEDVQDELNAAMTGGNAEPGETGTTEGGTPAPHRSAEEIAKAQADAEAAQTRLDQLEEELAGKRRSRHEQELHEIRAIAREREKLLVQAGVSDPAEFYQIAADEAAALADAEKKHREEEAKKAKQIQQERDAQRRDAEARIRELEIQADQTLTDKQKELARLEVQRQKALGDAKADDGVDPALINREYDLRRAEIERGDSSRESRDRVAGSFSAAALQAMGQGTMSPEAAEARKQTQQLRRIEEVAERLQRSIERLAGAT